MKLKIFVVLSFSLALLTVGCNQNQEGSPFSPGIDLAKKTSDRQAGGTATLSQTDLEPTQPLITPGSSPSDSEISDRGGKSNFIGTNAPGINRRENHPPDKPNNSDRFLIRTTHGELGASILPPRWNINWWTSDEELMVKIYGENFDTIVPESITLSYGSNSLTQTGFEWTDIILYVMFTKSGAIELIDNPIAGTAYEIQVSGTNADGAVLLTDTILIVGNKHREGYFSQINPDKWNVNWVDNTEELIVKISGGDPAAVDLGTISITGPVPTIPFISPLSTEVEEYNVFAKFSKQEAIGLFENPQKGDVYEVVVDFTADSVAYPQTHIITIVGSKKTGEYAVKISPDKWNVSWADNTDELTVKISGGDPTAIVSGTVFLISPDPLIPKLAPTNTEIDDNNFLAKFTKKDALALIDSPESGVSYVVTIEFTADAVPYTFPYTILMKGKK